MSVLLRAVGFIAFTVIFAWLARRVLGASRVSWLSALVSGLAGCATGAFVGWSLLQLDVNDDSSAIGAAIVTALLTTMLLIVALQLIRRPRSAPRRRTGIVGTVRASRRAAEVMRIAARHGLGPYVGRGADDNIEPSGAQLRLALEEAGVVFVKFGQMLAGRPDLVGPAMAAELGSLHDHVTPLDADVMEREIRREIPNCDEVFASVDWSPLGSASIAQVYAARLSDGGDVVIKVRRPGMDEEVRRDGQVVCTMTQLMERHSAWARTIGVAALARSFVADLERELDYRNEARAAIELEQALAGTGVGVPRIHRDLSGDDVLVMERVQGTTLAVADLSGVPAEVREGVAVTLVTAHVGAMLDGGRFHADPHPGNVMLTPDGGLAQIDFGATGVLSPSEQSALATLLLGIRMREPAMLRDALLEVSETSGPIDTARLDRSLSHLLAEHIRVDENVGPDAVIELLRIMCEEQLRLPASSSAMFRGLVTVLDSLERLAPGFAVLDAIDQTGDVQSPVPSTPQEFADLARDETFKLLPLLRRAPRLTDSIATQVERGDLSIRVRAFSHPDDIRFISDLVNRAVLAFVAVGLGIVSSVMFGLDKGPYLTTNLSVYDLLASIGLLAGAVLVMRVVLAALGDDSS
jgi:ubiquinone biosynthesis protein